MAKKLIPMGSQGKPVDLTPAPEVSLNYAGSDDLKTIERGIRETVRGQVLSVMAICKALHRIQAEELYRQAGLSTFGEYLDSRRIPVPKSTGSEYAKIGKALTEHADQLSRVDFTEADGLKKLLFLDQAIQNGGEKDALVRLGKDSFRDFRAFAKGQAERLEGGSHVRTEQETSREHGERLLSEVREHLDGLRIRDRAAFLADLKGIIREYGDNNE